MECPFGIGTGPLKLDRNTAQAAGPWSAHFLSFFIFIFSCFFTLAAEPFVAHEAELRVAGIGTSSGLTFGVFAMQVIGPPCTQYMVYPSPSGCSPRRLHRHNL